MIADKKFVPRVKPRSKRDIERLTRTIVESYRPKLLDAPGPFPIREFFEFELRKTYKLDPGIDDLSDGVEGITYPDGRVFVSEDTYIGLTKHEGRPRFTTAHECGHGIMHRLEIKRALVDCGKLVLHRRNDIPAYRDPEWQADYFAGALLMPASAVKLVIDDKHRLFWEEIVMRTFHVSHSAAEVRLSKLGYRN